MSVKSRIENELWIEKYRPRQFKDIVLPEQTRNLVAKWLKEGIIPNLLLCSLPGQGKTSLAKLIARDLFKVDYLYINASDENGVETIRSKVSEFARTASFDGNFKIIILDECDNFPSAASQKILRGLMEEVSDNCRFILTANYGHRVIDAIKSRCVMLDMTPPKVEVCKRLFTILTKEGVTIADEQYENIRKLVERHYPDIRATIADLSNGVNDGVLDLSPYTAAPEVVQGIINLIHEKNLVELRKYVIEHELDFHSNYQNLLEDIYHAVVDDDNIEPVTRAKWTITIGEYSARFATAIDPELNTTACLFKLCEI